MSYYGIYRGEVASVTDPDARYRYRVRVIPMHDTTLPVDHLPFAGLCAFVGKNFGDLPHYEVGDKVMVMFENGSRDHPVILGSWVAGQKDSAGNLTPDFPEDQADPFTDRRKRWERQDRDGNAIVMTEDAQAATDESLRVESVKKLVLKTQAGNLEITIEGDGTVTINGDMTINVTGNLVASVDGDATVDADGNVLVKSPTGTVDIESTTGQTTVTAPRVDVKSPDVRLGNTPSEKVVTESRLATFFNAHIHPDPSSGNTGVPVTPLVPGVVSSAEVQAT